MKAPHLGASRLLITLAFAYRCFGRKCVRTDIISCTAEADSADPCCTVSQPGLFSISQKWDFSEEMWKLDGFDMLNCDGTPFACTSTNSAQASKSPETAIPPGMEGLFDGPWYQPASCISTLQISCSTPAPSAAEVISEMIQTVVPKIDTKSYLANGDINVISPPARVYTYRQVVDALSHQSGFQALITCTGDYLTKVEYRFVAQGPFQNLAFVSPKHLSWGEMEAQRRSTNCPLGHIKYGRLQDLPDWSEPSPSSASAKPPTIAPSTSAGDAEKKPIVRKLGFFNQKNKERAPDEQVWKPTPTATGAPTRRPFGKAPQDL